jgi:hypothetical protein
MGFVTFSFLLWILGDSFFHRTWIMLQRKPPNDPCRIVINPGRLQIQWNEGSWFASAPPPPSIRSGFMRSPQSGSGHDLWFPDFYEWSDGRRSFDPPGTIWTPGAPVPAGRTSLPLRTYRITVALWMLPAAFLLIWVPILMLGRRRQRRIAAKLLRIPDPAMTN